MDFVHPQPLAEQPLEKIRLKLKEELLELFVGLLRHPVHLGRPGSRRCRVPSNQPAPGKIEACVDLQTLRVKYSYHKSFLPQSSRNGSCSDKESPLWSNGKPSEGRLAQVEGSSISNCHAVNIWPILERKRRDPKRFGSASGHGIQGRHVPLGAYSCSYEVAEMLLGCCKGGRQIPPLIIHIYIYR